MTRDNRRRNLRIPRSNYGKKTVKLELDARELNDSCILHQHETAHAKYGQTT